MTAPIGRDPKRVAMRKRRRLSAGSSWPSIVAAMLASAISFRADAQSEYMRGDRMPYDAFDRLPRTDLEVAGGTIHVALRARRHHAAQRKVLDWIRMSARAVTTYYGRFPVDSLRLLLVPVDGARIRGGTTWGYRGAAIRIPARPRVHRGCSAARLGDGARDGAHRPARHGRSLRMAVGRTGCLCRTGRAGAGRRSHGARKSGRR